MPAVFPQAGVEDILIAAAMFEEPGELIVADGLKEEADEEDSGTGDAAPCGGFIRRKPDKKDGYCDDGHEGRLEQIDLEPGSPEEVAPPVGAPLTVPEVFGFVGGADSDMRAEAKSPEANEGADE